MYSKCERPVISASIFYYDTDYELERAKQVLEVLKKYGMFPPEKIHADKLTKNKFVLADEQTEDIFAQAYVEKDVFGLDMSSADSRKSTDYWRVIWSLTYLKNSRIVSCPPITPWNTLFVHSTYDRLRNPVALESYLRCVKDLIEILNPFYAEIDDVSNKNRLQDRAGATHFIPDKLQVIYWGNYLGKQHVDAYGLDRLLNVPAGDAKQIGAGVFFTLSDSPLEFETKDVLEKRKKVKRYLNV